MNKKKRSTKTSKKDAIPRLKNGVRKDYKSPAEKRAALLKRDKKSIIGRPSSYPSVSKKLVFQLYLLGLSDEEVAPILEVSRETILNWKKQYPDFLGTIKQAKDIADSNVVLGLYKRAIGYKHKAFKFFYNSNKDKVVKEEYVEHYPPDVAAGQAWLRNRQPKRWNKTQDGDDDQPKSPVVNVNVITDPDTLQKLQRDRNTKTKEVNDKEQVSED